MPTLNDVYRKFGETSEAAQLLETELGTMLMWIGCIESDLVENPDPETTMAIYKRIDKLTLGQLVKKLGKKNASLPQLEKLLTEALIIRNQLAHSFYRRHNFRRNSEEGRATMMKELESMHDKLLEAYKSIMLLNGIDIDGLIAEHGDSPQPANHLPILCSCRPAI